MTVPDTITSGLTILLVALLYLFVWRIARAIGRHVASSAATNPPIMLRVVAPPHVLGQTFTVDRPLVAGRGPDADIVLDDPYTSDLHTRFAVQQGRLLVADLGSTNGTYVNENRVTGSVSAAPGDTVRLGQTIMEVR